MALTSPSGGLVWHARAWRRGHSWAEFHAGIADWLESWRPAGDDLLILGPSAGWCLPGTFLARFGRIHAVDFDPLAEPLFRWRHAAALRRRRTTLTWARSDFIAQLPQLLARYPEHVVLFANVLGQHRLHCTDVPAAERTLGALKTALRHRAWASFHDRLSGDWPAAAGTPPSFRVSGPLPTPALARRVTRGGEWLDHLTADVLPASAVRLLLPWRLTAGRLHWVEAGVSEPGDHAGARRQ